MKRFTISALALMALIATSSTMVAQPTAEQQDAAEQKEPNAAERAITIAQDDSLSLEERRKKLQVIANNNPESGTVWTAYGETLEELGQIDTAIMAYEKAIEKNPDLYTPWLRIGVLHKRGLPDPDYKRAREYLNKALTAGAPKAPTMNELAVAMALDGDMREAAGVWRIAITEDPQWGVLYTNLFKALLALDDWDAIEELIDEALDAERFEISSILRVGDAYLEEGEEDEAIALYRRAIEARPQDAELHYHLGIALEEDGEEEAAAASFRKAEELASSGETANFVLAQNAEFALFRLSHPDDEKRFQRIREWIFQPYDSQSKREGQMKRSIRALNSLIEKHPDFWNGYYLRGKAYRMIDEREEALMDLQKVLELEPREPNATMEIALVERDNLNFDRSAMLANRAVELAPRDPLFSTQAGLIMIDAGRCERAWELYRQATLMVGSGNTQVLKDQLDARCNDEGES